MLPWNAIERLKDHFGDYIVVATCRTCGHSREIMPAFLARLSPAGWDEPMARLVARLRCQCGSKGIKVEVGFNHKPHGWSKNPS